MKVDTAEARVADDVRRNLLSERDDDKQVGGGESFGVDVLRSEQGEVALDGEFRDRRRSQNLPTPRGAVRLAHDLNDMVPGVRQRLERGKSELAAARKDDPERSHTDVKWDGGGFRSTSDAEPRF